MANIHLSQNSVNFLLDMAVDHCERNLPTYLFIGANSSENENSLFRPLIDLLIYKQSISEVIKLLNKNQPVKVSLLLSTISGNYFIPKATYKSDDFLRILGLKNAGCKMYLVQEIKFQDVDYLFESSPLELEN